MLTVADAPEAPQQTLRCAPVFCMPACRDEDSEHYYIWDFEDMRPTLPTACHCSVLNKACDMVQEVLRGVVATV